MNGLTRRLGERFDAALATAMRLHREDTRKGKPIPYISHLLGVCSLVLADGGDEDEAIGALLHDTLEDHGDEITAEELRAQFGDRVTEIVVACSDTPADFAGGTKPPWRERKERYLAHLQAASPSARRVSLADKLYNARDLLADVRREGPATWDRFNAPRADQLWYFEAIAREMREAGDTGGLLDEFERVLADLRGA